MLGICLCFKDSAEYLGEWLAFHHVQGFRKFYLYDNGSSDDWKSEIAAWRDAGLVECFTFPGLGVQQQIYDDCLRRAAGKVEWLALLDDDEFLFPVDGRPLADVLAEFEPHAGVAVSWVLFGSGGAERKTPGLVIERFQASNGGADRHVKCIVRPHRIVRSILIGHAFEPVSGFSIVDENGVALAEPLNPNPSARKLRINHYLIKSWEEWRFRRARPQADTGLVTPHPEDKWREWDRDWSKQPDSSALRYKERMLGLPFS